MKLFKVNILILFFLVIFLESSYAVLDVNKVIQSNCHLQAYSLETLDRALETNEMEAPKLFGQYIGIVKNTSAKKEDDYHTLMVISGLDRSNTVIFDNTQSFDLVAQVGYYAQEGYKFVAIKENCITEINKKIESQEKIEKVIQIIYKVDKPSHYYITN